MYTIKEMPENQRPREILKEKGAEYLTEAALLAVILGNGYKGCNVEMLSQNLINHFGGLSNLLTASVSQISQIKGIGITKAMKLVSIFELFKRITKNDLDKKINIKNAEEIYDFLRANIAYEYKEIFTAIYLDRRNNITKINNEFSGTVDRATIYPRELLKKAIECNASSIIIAHNHPSGSLLPSNEDIMITKKIVSTMKTVDINVLDHLIITKEGFLSLAMEGYL